MFNLVSKFKPTGDQPKAIDSLVNGIKNQEPFQTLLGVTGSGKTFTIANVIEQVQKPTLIIAHNKTLAAQLCSEFREFFPDNAVEFFISYYDYYQPEAYLPQTDTYIDKEVQINQEIDRMRHKATMSLLTRNDVIVVASVSCIYGLGNPEEYFNFIVRVSTSKGKKEKMTFNRVGITIDDTKIKEAVTGMDDFVRQLIEMQYERNDFELKRGKFRIKGDTVDIYPAYQNELVRVVFWGDEVESIQQLDHITGQVKSSHENFYIYPASHYVTDLSKMKTALKNIDMELSKRLQELEKEGKTLEAHRLKTRTNYDLEMIKEIGFCSGIENYSRYLDGRDPGQPPAVLIDYFPRDFLLVLDESHITIPQIGSMYAGDRSRKDVLVRHGFRLPSARDNRPLKFEEFESKDCQRIFMSATPGDYEIGHSKENVVEQIIRPTGLVDPSIIIRPSEGQIADLELEIKQIIANKERVLITTLTKRMAEDLADYLSQNDIKVSYLHSEIDALERLEILHKLRVGTFDVLVGVNLLREGLDLPEVALVAVMDADKEGFLRAEKSLIQTIGRAARNVNGKVIFYADKMTKSMEKAIKETNRRRQIQLDYNKRHNIKPKTINKTVKAFATVKNETKKTLKNLTKDLDKFIHPQKLPSIIKKLETEMLKAADNLEFEKAAVLRDEIEKLKN